MVGNSQSIHVVLASRAVTSHSQLQQFIVQLVHQGGELCPNLDDEQVVVDFDVSIVAFRISPIQRTLGVVYSSDERNDLPLVKNGFGYESISLPS